MENLKYPIGKFKKPEIADNQFLNQCIQEIELFSGKLTIEVKHLTDEQLDTSYRPDGWTIRQVVHHCADSHMNSLIRFKLALTEDNPIIKPYFEERWAELTDTKLMLIEPSLKIIEGLHQRWVVLLRSLTKEDWEKTFVHPEHGKQIKLVENIGIYAWHCNHHLAHITNLKKSKNWR